MALTAVAVLVILAAAAWVAAPLVRRHAPAQILPPHERLSDLIEAKEAVYRSILDLEFDRKMNKVSEEDYAVMRAQHESEALQILAETDDAAWATDALEAEIAAARRRLRP